MYVCDIRSRYTAWLRHVRGITQYKMASNIQLTTGRDREITRRIKASQMLQSVVCAFRLIAGAATAEKLVVSH